MTKKELAATLDSKQAWLPGKRIKFDFGAEGVILLDGVAGRVIEEDGDADTSITISWSDLGALRRRELDPMSALLQGRIRIKGDMSNAMQLQSIVARGLEE